MKCSSRHPLVAALLLLASLVAISHGLHAEATASAVSPSSTVSPNEIRIAKFHDDRTSAVSLTFDDGLRNQNDVAVPFLDQYGLRATFFIIPGRTPETDEEAAKKKPGDWGGISWKCLKELAAKGHEIASHTWMHDAVISTTPDGRRVDMEPAKLDEAFSRAYQAIKEKIGVAPFTCATPGNASDDTIRAAVHKYHPVFREHLTERFGDWPPSGKNFTTEQANAIVDRHIDGGTQMVWMIHAVTDGYNAQSGPEVLGNHLKYLKSREDVLWVDTYAAVSRYVMERDAAKLIASSSGNGATFSLQCPLDSKLFNDPLTVVIPAPGAVKAEAKRSGSAAPLPVTIRDGKILVEAAPSSDPVVVSWSGGKS